MMHRNSKLLPGVNLGTDPTKRCGETKPYLPKQAIEKSIPKSFASGMKLRSLITSLKGFGLVLSGFMPTHEQRQLSGK